MNSAELNRMFIEKFPNLQGKYIAEVSWQEGDDTGSHTVYGDVLVPYLIDCILKDNEHDFQNIFNFLEQLLSLEDNYVDEVVYFSVLESITYIFKERIYLIQYLGAKCKNALNEMG